ncbi:hypothetical protein ACFFIF_11580 [Vagococcus entomophilus]|uniref:Uncharacterized protein n=1 Tax=Vagococcus entomophilus TaxID=1160095 RepID=A0A430AEU0_9ENTE|nr:hypothetical protein [Vagococcus entomophilus]RSU05927.1 hypothetical protein CBF30_11485 [Vagococcus entomophilus]
MHKALVLIITDQILTQYASEQSFCQNYLDVTLHEWQQWKKGNSGLNAEKMQKIKNLFSDYEWMLVQKTVQRTALLPEKRNYVVLEYKHLKTLIAKKWLDTGAAEVELITQKSSFQKATKENLYNKTIQLRVVMDYGVWGYEDILEFYLPAIVQNQIEESQVNLLEWVNDQLTETYVKKLPNSEIIEDENE